MITFVSFVNASMLQSVTTYTVLILVRNLVTFDLTKTVRCPTNWRPDPAISVIPLPSACQCFQHTRQSHTVSMTLSDEYEVHASASVEIIFN